MLVAHLSGTQRVRIKTAMIPQCDPLESSQRHRRDETLDFLLPIVWTRQRDAQLQLEEFFLILLSTEGAHHAFMATGF